MDVYTSEIYKNGKELEDAVGKGVTAFINSCTVKIPDSNLNNVTESGFYNIEDISDFTNVPDGLTGNCRLTVMGDSTLGRQTLVNNKNDIYYRDKLSGETWGEWEPVLINYSQKGNANMYGAVFRLGGITTVELSINAMTVPSSSPFMLETPFDVVKWDGRSMFMSPCFAQENVSGSKTIVIKGAAWSNNGKLWVTIAQTPDMVGKEFSFWFSFNVPSIIK